MYCAPNPTCTCATEDILFRNLIQGFSENNEHKNISTLTPRIITTPLNFLQPNQTQFSAKKIIGSKYGLDTEEVNKTFNMPLSDKIQ